MTGKSLFSKKEHGPRVNQTDGRLTIDCTACGGPSDISDRGCAACICRILKGTGELESIHLRSATDTMYLGESADIIRDLTSVYSLMVSDLSDRKGSRCRRCKNSYSHIVADQIPMFPDIDTEELRDRTDQIMVSSDICRICINDSARVIDEMAESLDSIRKRLGMDREEE